MARLIDISPRLHPGIAVWPGDVPLRRDVALSIAGGDTLELSSVTTTVHVGAHTDAPSHYVPGPDIASRDPALYIGPCEVVSLKTPGLAARNRRITADDLVRLPSAPRVLLRTGSFPDPDHFNEDFAALDPSLVAVLADRGVRLIGIDTPSVDLCHDKALLAHHAIAEHDLAILEGIVLDGVPDGAYTLLAAPLPLVGFDASPVRALLHTGTLEDPLEAS